jgi:hypothetical protein
MRNQIASKINHAADVSDPMWYWMQNVTFSIDLQSRGVPRSPGSERNGRSLPEIAQPHRRCLTKIALAPKFSRANKIEEKRTKKRDDLRR